MSEYDLLHDERYLSALSVLMTDEAKEAFKVVRLAYPDLSIFWDVTTVSLENDNMTITIE